MMAGTHRDGGVSRRGMLKGTALAAAGVAAPIVLPGLARGAAAPSNRITIGMIGMGRQAYHSNVRSFLGMKDVQVVAVCDVDTWRLDNGRKRVNERYAAQTRSGTYKGCATTRDFRDILARDDIDAVMISTPDHWHVPMAIAAAKAGKDICCEKPLTLTIHEGRVLSDTVRRYERVFRTDSEFRSHWYFHKACELVRNGRIGRLRRIRTGVPKGDVGCPPQPIMPVPKELDYDAWLGPAAAAPYTERRVHRPKSYSRPGWMRVRDTCDGMICNWGTHLNDIAHWGGGFDRTGPVEIEGTGTYPEDGGLWNVLTSFTIHYRYANGVTLDYFMDRPYVRFEGDEGWIHANYGGKLEASSPSILTSKIGAGETPLVSKHEKRDFIDCVKTRATTMADAEVGHRTNSMCHLGHIAVQTGCKLRWDPDTERFDNDPRATRYLTKAYRPPWTV